MHKLGEFQLEVPPKVIDAIKQVNTQSDKNTTEYDVGFIKVVLSLCFQPSEQIMNVTEHEIMEFVRGKYVFKRLCLK